MNGIKSGKYCQSNPATIGSVTRLGSLGSLGVVLVFLLFCGNFTCTAASHIAMFADISVEQQVMVNSPDSTQDWPAEIGETIPAGSQVMIPENVRVSLIHLGAGQECVFIGSQTIRVDAIGFSCGTDAAPHSVVTLPDAVVKLDLQAQSQHQIGAKDPTHISPYSPQAPSKPGQPQRGDGQKPQTSDLLDTDVASEVVPAQPEDGSLSESGSLTSHSLVSSRATSEKTSIMGDEVDSSLAEPRFTSLADCIPLIAFPLDSTGDIQHPDLTEEWYLVAKEKSLKIPVQARESVVAGKEWVVFYLSRKEKLPLTSTTFLLNNQAEYGSFVLPPTVSATATFGVVLAVCLESEAPATAAAIWINLKLGNKCPDNIAGKHLDRLYPRLVAGNREK